MRRIVTTKLENDDRPFIYAALPNGDELFIFNEVRPDWATEDHWNDIMAMADEDPLPARRQQHTAEIIDIEDLRARRGAWREGRA